MEWKGNRFKTRAEFKDTLMRLQRSTDSESSLQRLAVNTLEGKDRILMHDNVCFMKILNKEIGPEKALSYDQ